MNIIYTNQLNWIDPSSKPLNLSKSEKHSKSQKLTKYTHTKSSHIDLVPEGSLK